MEKITGLDGKKNINTLIKPFPRFLLVSVLIMTLFSCDKPRHKVTIEYSRFDGTNLEKFEIITYRNGLSLIAELKTKGRMSHHVKLGEGYVPLIPLFVRELETIDTKNECPIIDSYRVFIDGKFIQKTDRTCQWNGFHRLKQALFYSTEQQSSTSY